MMLDGLNEQQRQAVITTAPHVSIVAGPGTGKTKTLVARLAYLLAERDVVAKDVIALTFTVKAAREIQERIAALTSKDSTTGLRITTFHGLCYELLQHGRTKSLQIITEADRLALVRELRKSADLRDMTARELLARLSWAKSLPPSKTPDEPGLAALLKLYAKALEQKSLLDFDDLLLQTHARLQNATKPHASHLLVDEFQDTSELQYDILRLLQPKSLLVIGDPLQSIYGFRGASGEVFDRLTEDYPDAERITLATNYRSAPAVVKVGNAIFPDAPQLRPHRSNEGRVQTVEVLNEYSEAAWITSTIEAAIGGTDFLRSHQATQDSSRHCTFRDFAVLYRTHRAAATTQRALAESGIPYQIVGEGSPYEQPLPKTIIATLRWLHNPTDEGLVLLRDLPLLHGFSTRQLRHILASTQTDATPSQLAHSVLEALQLRTDKPTAQRDLNQFMGTLVRFDKLGLDAYLPHLDAIAEEGFYDPSANAVTLLTIHASKGLEFDHVFLLACEEGLLPHDRPGATTNIEEEQRLFYVATTRAKTNLDILHARTRAGQPATPSRFITAIPSHILPRTTDPELSNQLKRAHKRRQKRSQLDLFS